MLLRSGAMVNDVSQSGNVTYCFLQMIVIQFRPPVIQVPSIIISLLLE